MFTAYDWMKPTRKQNNFQKDLGEFSRSEEMTRKFAFEPKFARKRPFNGKKTLMIGISTEYFD